MLKYTYQDVSFKSENWLKSFKLYVGDKSTLALVGK